MERSVVPNARAKIYKQLSQWLLHYEGSEGEKAVALARAALGMMNNSYLKFLLTNFLGVPLWELLVLKALVHEWGNHNGESR